MTQINMNQNNPNPTNGGARLSNNALVSIVQPHTHCCFLIEICLSRDKDRTAGHTTHIEHHTHSDPAHPIVAHLTYITEVVVGEFLLRGFR